jgi:hypothetical protein
MAEKNPKPDKPARPSASLGLLVVAWSSFVVSLLTLGLLGAGYYFVWLRYIEHKIAAQEELRNQPKSVLVEYRCSASIDAFICSFTNTTQSDSLPLCVRGQLVRAADATRLDSMPACSGTVARGSTVEVRVHWVGGSPGELCNRTSYGNEVLDWSKCDFNVSRIGPG